MSVRTFRPPTPGEFSILYFEFLPALPVPNTLTRPERVGPIERNVIRVGLYEMRHGDDVPDAVAISEAVEVAKRFGSEEAPLQG